MKAWQMVQCCNQQPGYIPACKISIHQVNAFLRKIVIFQNLFITKGCKRLKESGWPETVKAMPVNKCLFTLLGLLPPFSKMGIFLTAIKTKCQQTPSPARWPMCPNSRPFCLNYWTKRQDNRAYRKEDFGFVAALYHRLKLE